MIGTGHQNDGLFDDPEAEEERLAAEEQAELDAADAMDQGGRSGFARQQASGDDPDAVLSILDKLKAENEELKDKALRAVAEMENLRRRTQREIADARAYAVSNFARDMLGVTDNLQRAITAVPVEKREQGSDEFKSFIEGVEMTEREMLRVMENNGVKRLNPRGEKFDPNFHQAMFEVPNTEVPNNSVFEVVQEGYSIGERVLRPALVGVAKGGPKFEEVAAQEPQEQAVEADSEAGAA